MRPYSFLLLLAFTFSDAALGMSISNRYAFKTSTANINKEVCVPVTGSLPGNLLPEEEFARNSDYIGTLHVSRESAFWHYFTSFEGCRRGIKQWALEE